jgi:plasmid stabilization system protein ParE
MKYQIVLTERAARDLEEAYRWYAERAPQAAVRWYNGFLDSLEGLASNPERCGIAAESRTFGAEIRQLLYGRRRTYRALFVIRHQNVVVLHIRHTARQDASSEELF